jgi:glycosyltransferase involved in cell wall biosynthesis
MAGVRLESFPDWLGSTHFAMAPGLWRRLRTGSGGWGVVHAHSFHASAALAASCLTTDPLVFSPHYHGTGHTAAARVVHRIYDPIAASLFTRAGAVICVSQAEADSVAADYPKAGPKISVVYNGVDQAQLLASAPFEPTFRTILMAGRLERYKGVDQVIRAMAAVPDEARLVVAGDGVDRDRLEQLAAELSLSQRVIFLGRIPVGELRRWQRTAALTVSLSEHEAFGLTLLEGVAAGSVVLASDIPAHREVNQLTGGEMVLVPLGISPGDLAAAMRAAMDRERSGPGPDLSELTWETAGARLLEIYRSLA